MMIIISRPLKNNDIAYPGNPKNSIEQKHSLTTDGFESHQINLFTHNGTHIEAPRHMINGKRLDEYNTQRFIFKKIQIDTYRSFAMQPGKDLLLLTAQRKRKADNYPHITTKMAKKIIVGDYTCVGVDMISIGEKHHSEEAKQVHKMLFEKDILIIEDMDLSSVKKEPKSVIVAPLQIKNIEAAPCTIYAEV